MARSQETERTARPKVGSSSSAPPDSRNEVTAWTGMWGGSKSDPLVGTTLNEAYVVERLVAEGGMGRVYEARHTRIPQKRCAIKVLRPEFAANLDALARFQREAENAASVTHPNVIGVYDVDRTPDGAPYLVCEYLEGRELGDHLEAVGKLDPLAAVHICYEICKALEAAHASGVIHRDLKPQNVFLVGKFEEGVPAQPIVKVLDFGLSRFQNAGGNSLTRTGMVMGTPSYMAPEQARGQKTDHRTDIYGVGAILYTLLTGRPPFAEETPHLTVLAVMDRDPPRPRSIDPAISQHLELIVQRAMAKEPADRYPDAMALKHALDLFANPEGSEMLPARAAQPTSPFSVDREAAQVQNARPRLVVTMVLAAAFVTALLAMALVSIGVLTGWLTFRPVEMALLFGSALGTSLTPGIILVRRLRRVVWNNTARVLDATERVAVPFMAGLLGYGTANLVVRFGDMVLARFADARLFGHPSGIAWPGWDLVFPVVGGIWSGVVWVRHAVLGEMAGTWRRRLIGPALYAAGLSLAASAVYGGLTWRASSALPTAVAPDVPIAAGHPMPAPEPSHHAASATSHTQVPRASRDELAAGVTAGLDALVALSQKYPDDPDVLQSLVFAYAARSTRHLDAIQAAKSLFRISPEKVDDADLRVLITSVAKTSKTASEAAIQLMASDMGASGPDLLYDVMLSRTTASAQAENALATAAVQARFSPALRIAYELRNASSCAARLPLLERASLLGDARSIGILDPLSKHTRRGCGKWRNRPCAPPCVKEAERYRNAIGKISARIRREQ